MSPEPVQKRILLVDDEKPLRFLFSMALEGNNYLIDEAADGREALSLLDSKDYDLVLLDLSMPGISGLDVLDEMRARQDLTKVQVISAYTPGSAILRAVSQGVCDFVGKPMGLDFLRRVVAEGLEQDRKQVLAEAHCEASQLRFSRAAECLRRKESSLDREEQTWLELFDALARKEPLQDLSYLKPRLQLLVRTDQ